MATTIKLSKPLVLEPAIGDAPAKTVAELALNLDALSGADYQMCEREAIAETGDSVPLLDPRLSVSMQAHIASRACGLPVETLRRLGMRDFANLVAEVRNFFIVEE